MGEQELAPGLRIDDRYELLEQLGVGSVGEVWLATDARLPGRRVAVKFLGADRNEDQRARLHDALAIAAMTQLQHPAVVTVTDRGEWEQRQYLVTDYQEGPTLEHWLAERRGLDRPPSLSEVWSLFEPLLDGLASAHAMPEPGPVVHENLRPSNIVLVTGPRGDLQVRVLDFGAFRLSGRTSLPSTGASPYASPEQAAGQSSLVSPASDVFSLAVLLVEMLTLSDRYDGEAPWWATAMQRDHELLGLLRGLRPEVPVEVWEVVARAMRSRIPQRIPTAGALQEALRAVWPLPSAVSVAQGDDNLPTVPRLGSAVAIDPLPELAGPPSRPTPVASKLAIEAPPVLKPPVDVSDDGPTLPPVRLEKPAAAKSEKSDKKPVSATAKATPPAAPVKAAPAPATTPAAGEKAARTVSPVVWVLGLGALAGAGWFAWEHRHGGPTAVIAAYDAGIAPVVLEPPPARDAAPELAVVASLDAAPEAAATGPCPEGMVLVAGTTFVMGAADRGATDDERPAHTVSLRPFCLSVHEVTVDAYGACQRAGHCPAPTTTASFAPASEADLRFWSQLCNAARPDHGDHPMNCVDWAAANSYCEAQGGALPTEAQWELGARGPSPRAYPWGDEAPDPTRVNACGPECRRGATAAGWAYSGHWDDDSGESCHPGEPDQGSVHCDCVSRFGDVASRRACRFGLSQAYTQEDPFESTAPVGRMQQGASPSGAQDMAGNVWEWTADRYAPYSREAQQDPTGPASGALRGVRGGGWSTFEPTRLRATRRLGVDPAWRHADLGFRCAAVPLGERSAHPPLHSGGLLRDGSVTPDGHAH